MFNKLNLSIQVWGRVVLIALFAKHQCEKMVNDHLCVCIVFGWKGGDLNVVFNYSPCALLLLALI